MKLSHRIRTWITLVIVSIVSGFLFFGIDLAHQTTLNSIVSGTIIGIIIYAIVLVLSGFFVFIKKPRYVLWSFYVLLAIETGHIFYNLYFLIFNPNINDNGVTILIDAMLIWSITLLAFAIWYWLIDGSGPFARHNAPNEHRPDFLFPQQQAVIKGYEKWMPDLLDYMFLSFFTGTGFSPADTLPLTKKAKIFMMIEAMISLTIIGMVVSRAVAIIN
jgi:hypothetical protein